MLTVTDSFARQPEMNTRAPSRRLVALREGTREAHDRIEGVACMRRLLSQDYTLAEYRKLLRRTYGFIAPLDAAMARFTNDSLRLGCERSRHLQSDLLALGDEEGVWGRIPQATLSFDLDSLSARVGVVYVLEGSSLGGQIIRRALLNRFGQHVEHAVSYFDCYPGQHGRVWRDVCARLEALPDELDVETSIRSAKHLFQQLAVWLHGEDSPADLGPHLSTAAAAGSRCPWTRVKGWATMLARTAAGTP